jgi:hypothetical protein
MIGKEENRRSSSSLLRSKTRARRRTDGSGSDSGSGSGSGRIEERMTESSRGQGQRNGHGQQRRASLRVKPHQEERNREEQQQELQSDSNSKMVNDSVNIRESAVSNLDLDGESSTHRVLSKHHRTNQEISQTLKHKGEDRFHVDAENELAEEEDEDMEINIEDDDDKVERLGKVQHNNISDTTQETNIKIVSLTKHLKEMLQPTFDRAKSSPAHFQTAEAEPTVDETELNPFLKTIEPLTHDKQNTQYSNNINNTSKNTVNALPVQKLVAGVGVGKSKLALTNLQKYSQKSFSTSRPHAPSFLDKLTSSISPKITKRRASISHVPSKPFKVPHCIN